MSGGVLLRRFLRGGVATYRRFLFTADPAHRFHCWTTIQTVSAGLEQMERAEVGHEGSGAAPDGPDLERSLTAGWTDRPH